MQNQNRNASVTDRDLILDRIYQIALEPHSIEDFIEYWHQEDLTSQLEDSDKFDSVLSPHLERAETILQQGVNLSRDLAEYLRPYDNLAAFVVGSALTVEAANQAAQAVFHIQPGSRIDQISLPSELQEPLARSIQDILHYSRRPELLLRGDLADKEGAILFRVMRIAQSGSGGAAALIVSTQFHWREALGALLMRVFHLTKAEQGVVRLLVEGKSLKQIAKSRTTSEGTVRGQIKAISSKLNVRTQTDIVRLVMALGEFPKGSMEPEEAAELSASSVSRNWLAAEVWKPFKSVSLPGGRKLTYHEMGPKDGSPILISHMGSCMVRWPISMLRMAFDSNLRVICPIRAGYGNSEGLDPGVDPVAEARCDVRNLLRQLGIRNLPYAVQGSDLPLAADLVAAGGDVVTEVVGIGGQIPLPNGKTAEGVGRWQKFFVSAARSTPNLAFFASKAVMGMCQRIGPEAMLRRLCKDSHADLAMLENDETKEILIANISLMAGKSTNAAQAFASEYIAFQRDWHSALGETRDIPVKFFLGEEDPTIDLNALPMLREAYPWMSFEVLENAGLGMMYQRPETLIPHMASAAKRAAFQAR